MSKKYWVHNYDPNVARSGIFSKIMFSELKKHDEEFVDFFVGRPKNYFKYIRRYYCLMKKINHEDIVFVQYGSIIGALFTTFSVKTMLYVRGSDFSYEDWVKTDSVKVNFQRWLTYKLTSFAIKKSDTVFFVSNRLLKKACHEIKNQNIKFKNLVVLPSPISYKFRDKKNGKLEARERLGIPDDVFYCITPFINSGSKVKRSSLVSEVVDHFKLVDTVKVVQISSLSQDELIWHYQAADATMILSENEGYPNVVKESLACGAPFISTDVSDLKLLAEIYHCGVIVEPDLESIIFAVKKISKDHSYKLGAYRSPYLFDLDNSCKIVLDNL